MGPAGRAAGPPHAAGGSSSNHLQPHKTDGFAARRQMIAPRRASGYHVRWLHIMRVRAAFVLLALVMAGQQSAQILQVTPLPRDGEVLVSFKLDEAMTDDIKAAIQS